jgi:hypothetical protein
VTIQPVIIKIPGERADQLKRLADSHNLSMADTIGMLINQEIGAGRLDESLTGLDVTLLKDRQIRLSILGIGDLTVKRGHALSLAKSLDEAAARKRRTATLDFDVGLLVSGAGPAVKLKAVESDASRVLAPSIARDFANLIRKAASEG